jgi:(E)-4-hydroxy-3-methylbut-2-enyl-diphosphate synthase
VREVARAAKKARIPIRIGVNSGSAGGSSPEALVGAARRYIKILEGADFHDIIISLKASDVLSTVEAYRKMSRACDYPLHLGVTAAGSYESGIVKSAIGIGSLLLDGIGDTVRVSLTSDPVEEVNAAKRILSSLGLRRFGPEVVSCPTCGRCQVDLVKIVDEFERKLTTYPAPEARDSRTFHEKCAGLRFTTSPVTIAIMGCEVNGPGEAREADIGIAFGKGSGMLFRKGKLIKKVAEKDAIRELLRCL